MKAVVNETLAVGTHVFQVPPGLQTNIIVDELGSGGTANVAYTYDGRVKSDVFAGTIFASDVASAEWSLGDVARGSETLRGPVTAVQITVTTGTVRVTISSARKVRKIFPSAGFIITPPAPSPNFSTAREFDGATRNRLITHPDAPVGVSDGRVGTLSFWFNIATPVGTTEMMLLMSNYNLLAGHPTAVQLRAFPNGASLLMQMILTTTGSSNALSMSHGGTITGDRWHHFMCSWDHAFPVDAAAHATLYYDGVLQVDGVGSPPAIISQGSSDLDIGYATDGTEWTQGSKHHNFDGGGFGGPKFLDGCLANFYLNTNERIDLSVQANREKFRGSDGEMIDLGADGSIPTGSSPPFFAANGDLSTNEGTGEDLPTITGAVTDCADAPFTGLEAELPVSGFAYTADNYVLATPGAGFDSDTTTISLWFKWNSAASAETNNFMIHFSGGRLLIDISSPTGVVFFEGWNSSPTKIQRIDSNAIATLLTDDAWHHLLITRDGTTVAGLYIDDVDQLNSHSVNMAGNISLGSLGWYVGMAFNNTFGWKGCLSNLWIDTTVGYDLSIVGNRRKFISAALEPIDPGADGSGPTGSAPIVWIPNGLPTTNAGSQGNFSLTSGDGAVAC